MLPISEECNRLYVFSSIDLDYFRFFLVCAAGRGPNFTQTRLWGLRQYPIQILEGPRLAIL